MQGLLMAYLMGLLRYALVGVFTWLTTNGISTPEQNDQLLAGIAGFLAMALWLFWVKYKDVILRKLALRLPANSSPAELADVAAATHPKTAMVEKVLGLVLAVSLFSVSCASIPRVQPLPEHVEMADAQVLAVTGNLQQLLTLAAKVVDDVSRIEEAAAKSGAIPPSVDAQFDAAMLAYAAASQRASDALVSGGLKTWPELRALVEPVLARGQALIDMASDIGAIKTRVQAFLIQLRDLLSAAAGEFLVGGAR